MPDVVMPRLSDSMEEGTVLQWLKAVGDEVAVGDELVEIETDKANMAYESDVAGTLTEIVAQEGETLPIGSVIARVGEGAAPAPAAQASTPAAGDGQRPKASPLARRLARERGLSLAELHGSGPGGRIVKADVEAVASPAGDAGVGGFSPSPEAAEGKAPSLQAQDPGARSSAQGQESPPTPAAGPAAGAVSPETAKGSVSYEDPSKLQSTVARRMAESKATAPHFYLRADVDMSRAVHGRALLKGSATEGDVVPSFNDMAVKACALALREHPRANGAYRDGRFELYSRVNVGVAVAARDALVVPTLFDADRKGLRQLAIESRELAQRVRDGQITPPELSGATFTVSNLGMYGIDSFSAVINPPQAAILAVGAIEERPVVRDGEIATAHLMTVDLACDHRILYGAPAAEFLARIKVLLEEPLSLAL
jgi:pyruvate dehydrogenase E2 component (dihydrolipoamide acetyltransferase)